MNELQLVADSATLSEKCKSLASQSSLSLDTEFMREKTYAPVLSLLQVATKDDIFCIDMLSIEELEPIYSVLEDENVELVLHSCRQDFEALDCLHAFLPNHLFDTQIAAAFSGYGDQVSYAAMVEEICGVSLAKSHTRANWLARPLSKEEILYALDDVRYLQEIKTQLHDQLMANGRISWFEDECRNQCAPNLWRADPQQAWKKLKGAARLPIEAQKAAKMLAIWREQQAVDRNRPREWILSTASLLEVCRQNPTSIGELGAIDGIPKGFVRSSGDTVLGILSEAERQKDAEPIWHQHAMMSTEERKKVKAVMGLIRSTAEAIGISPSILANRSSVEKFVRGTTDLDLFKGWRLEVVGQEILSTNY